MHDQMSCLDDRVDDDLSLEEVAEIVEIVDLVGLEFWAILEVCQRFPAFDG